MNDLWRRFRRSRSGSASLLLLLLMYSAALLAGFLAPWDPNADDTRVRFVPPQGIHLREAGHWHSPFVWGLAPNRDPDTQEIHWSPDHSTRFPLLYFHQGHLVSSEGPFFLLGTDRLGRDLFSRLLIGARVSLTVGLAGTLVSLLIGALMGVVSAFYGGWVDLVMQRAIEVLASFPAIPLWMALAAVLPVTWSSLQIYLAITVILSLLGWGALARQVRGKILSTREADYVMAARAAGAGDWYLIRKHLFPSTLGHLIATATVSIPGMILGETALSFLGLGIRPPMVSWGVLLEDAQRITVLLHYPWLLFPAVPVVVTVVAWNLVGDALRDAVDPFRN